MTALSATSAATASGSEQALALAHGVHYAIVAAGIVGILALLLPQLHERRSAPTTSGSELPATSTRPA